MTPKKTVIRVYSADVSPLADPETYLRFYQAASAQRKQKTDKLRFFRDKCLSLGAEALLQQACFHFGVKFEEQTIEEDSFCKPFFRNGPLHFNLSHSENRVMCVAGMTPVGCDVEKVKPVDIKIAKRFFFQEEFEEIIACKSPEERTELFFRLWTLKESFMKCTGLGFHLPLNAFSVLCTGETVSVRHSVDSKEYSFFEFDENDGYKYACCIQKPDDNSELSILPLLRVTL